MNKCYALIVLLTIASQTYAEEYVGPGVCLPNALIIGMPADSAMILLDASATADAIQPVATQVLMISNRCTGVRASYRMEDVPYSAAKNTLIEHIGKPPDEENTNSAYWNSAHDSTPHVRASISYQSRMIHVVFTSDP